MCNKCSIDDVRQKVECRGYKLLSTEYINNKQKLDVQCDKGHTFQIRYNDFLSGHGCSECKGLKKLTYDNVKRSIENKGYKLLSTEYKNSATPLDMQCSNGHFLKKTFNNFQSGYGCQICAGNKKLTIEKVKQMFKDQKYELLSTEYINSQTKLDTICPNGHKWSVTWNNFQRGNRCMVCSRNDGNHVSKGEKQVVEYVKYIYDGEVIENDRTVVYNTLTGYPLELDIYLPTIKKAIEFGSKFYHNKPDQIQRDNEKVIQCKDKNIDLLSVEYNYWAKQNVSCKKQINNFIYGLVTR
jgi:hypothetical protein